MYIGNIVPVICVIVPIILAVYNISHNNNSAKKRVVITTCVFVGLFALALFSAFIEDRLDVSDRRDGTVITGGLLGSLHYEHDSEGYHVFYSSEFLGGDDYIAVPDSVDLPPFVSIWNEVTIISTEKSISGAVGVVTVDGHSCDLMPENTKIRGSYLTLDLFIMFISALGFAIYEVIRAIVTFVRGRHK